MIKSNSDHVLRTVDSTASSTAVKLATMVMANSSGNLLLSACKRNSLCTCADNENHPNAIKSFCEEKQNCTEHQTSENKKCKLIVASDDQRDRLNSSRSNSNSQQRNHQNNQQHQQNENNPQQPQDNSDRNQQQNNDQDNNEDEGLDHFQMPNQMVDHNNNIIEPELMLVDVHVDENNNLVGLPDANFDLNNNYIWNNNADNNLERPQDNNQPNGLNDQQNQQEPNQNNNGNERSSQPPNGSSNLSMLKEGTNIKCKSSQCNSAGCCKTIDRSTCASHLQSVQIRQRKKLLELDLNKPRSSNHQFYSPMNEEENVIKEEDSGSSSTSGHQYIFKRSSSSGRRKKSLQCKKCLTKHLTSKCEKTSGCKLESMSKCEHYHSMDCPTPEGLVDSKKHVGGFKKATTPLTLCPIATTPTIKEQLVTSGNADSLSDVESNLSSSGLSANEITQQQANKSLEPNLRESTATSLTASLISAQCPICLFTLSEPSRPNNCQHSFCSVCVIEWAKVGKPIGRENGCCLWN